jgi:hypothetical protein
VAHANDLIITNSSTYHITKEAWKKAYQELVQENKTARGTTYIAPLKGNGYSDKLHKNKARDTVLFIPENIDFKKPIDFIYWFHGLGGFKERDFRTRVLRHTKNIKKNKNYIIIIPEMPWSTNTSTPKTRQTRVFQKEGQFSLFTNSVIKIVDSLFSTTPVIGNVCLLGHSAGGGTLMSISKSKGLDWLYNQKKIGTIKIIFSDAAYGYWLSTTWKHFKSKQNGVEYLLLTRKGGKPYRLTMRFLKKFKTIPKNIKHTIFKRKKTHEWIGNNSFRWVYPEENLKGENK